MSLAPGNGPVVVTAPDDRSTRASIVCSEPWIGPCTPGGSYRAKTAWGVTVMPNTKPSFQARPSSGFSDGVGDGAGAGVRSVQVRPPSAVEYRWVDESACPYAGVS